MTRITQEHIQQILAAAQQASAQIMHVYKTQLEITKKEDNTPVTNADMASHKILAESLPQILDIPLLSEEGEFSLEEVAKWDEFWVVDPLDGTKGFINETDDFAINIAIVAKGRPVFGMIYVPINQQVYYAAQGQGAFKLDNQKWHPIKVAEKFQKGSGVNKPTVISSRPSPSVRTQTLCQEIGDYDYTSMGSAIKFVVLAEGGAHLYPRFGPSSWWDAAAGQCIVEEAGGAVLDDQLQPLRYDSGDDLLNTNFIACASQEGLWRDPWLKINRDMAQAEMKPNKQ
ncbi:MAG: 3'(2'),5'-bisphosphate nucleotidase CysQ [Candidatus Portiera sp.]|nr:3'(2'),5'-bisphosphate nucleotidase CysQ [Portiera sp.]